MVEINTFELIFTLLSGLSRSKWPLKRRSTVCHVKTSEIPNYVRLSLNHLCTCCPCVTKSSLIYSSSCPDESDMLKICRLIPEITKTS